MSTTLPAASVAAAVFHKVSNIENDVRAAEDLFTAISFIAEALNDDHASGPIMHLCNLGRRDMKKIEEVRGEVFQETHRFAYPGATQNREAGHAA